MKNQTLFGTIALLCVILGFGTTLSAKDYKRVVSLAPSITTCIYNMGAQGRLIGCTNYCQAAKGDNKEIVASAVQPYIEKIASLKPDLVLVLGLTAMKDVETMKKLGLNVYIFESPRSFDEICEQYIEIGVMLGKETETKQCVANVKRRVNGIKAKSLFVGRKSKVFMQLGASPLFAVIPNTFMNDFITYNGGDNICKDLNKGTIGRELVVSRMPDYIYVISMEATGNDEKADWERFKHIPAVKNKHVYIIDANMACQPTPQSFLHTLELMHKQMYK